MHPQGVGIGGHTRKSERYFEQAGSSTRDPITTSLRIYIASHSTIVARRRRTAGGRTSSKRRRAGQGEEAKAACGLFLCGRGAPRERTARQVRGGGGHGPCWVGQRAGWRRAPGLGHELDPPAKHRVRDSSLSPRTYRPLAGALDDCGRFAAELARHEEGGKEGRKQKKEKREKDKEKKEKKDSRRRTHPPRAAHTRGERDKKKQKKKDRKEIGNKPHE